MKKNKEGAINFLNELLKDIPKEEQKEHLEKLIQVMNSLKNLNDNSIFNQLKREEKSFK